MSQLTNLITTPPILQKLQWVADPVGYMKTSVQKYPDIFTSQVVGFGTNLVFVNEPQAIQQILTNDRKQFTAPGELNQILSPILGNTSVMTISGDRHKKRRQLVMPAFHGSRMQNYGQLVADLTNKVLQEAAKNSKGTNTFLVRDEMQNISLQIILQAVFGLYEGDRADQIKHLMGQMSELFRSPLTSAALFFNQLQKDWGEWSPWGNFIRQRANLDRLLYQEIADRRAHLDLNQTDILTMLLSSTDEDGNGMTDLEVRDELMALLLAGHETTATSMAWCLYWVHQLPEVKEKLQHELSTISDRRDWMSIFKLPYLTAVCNETLRIHPIAMLTFPRVAQEDVQLLGHQLEANTILCGCIYLLHQREELYPEPEKFKPERFLERQFSPYEFMPFGGGARRCVGEALAQFEMKIVLATIMSNYDLELCDRRPVKPQRRGVTLAPAGDLKMRIK